MMMMVMMVGGGVKVAKSSRDLRVNISIYGEAQHLRFSVSHDPGSAGRVTDKQQGPRQCSGIVNSFLP